MVAWQLIVAPKRTGNFHMEEDLKLFQAHEEGTAGSTLRIYSWQPKCISLGYSQKVEHEIDLNNANKIGWDHVCRTTGGGIVFHNEEEVTYSLVTSLNDPSLPEGLIPSYRKLSEAIVKTLNYLGVKAEVSIQAEGKRQEAKGKRSLCFSYPAEYEVVAQGKKLVGSAQKRGRKTLLQQGSIFVKRTEDKAFSILRRPCDDLNAISVEEILGKKVGFEEVSSALIRGFEECLNINLKV